MNLARSIGAGLLIAGAVPASAQESGASRFALARLEVAGPISGIRLSIAGGGETLIEGSLSRGESRSLTVPVALPAGLDLARDGAQATEALARVEVTGEGSASFAGFGPEAEESARAARARLPLGLLERPPPGLEERAGGARAALGALLLVAAAFAALLALRSRGLLAAAVAAAASALVVLVQRPPEGPGEGTAACALDGDLQSGAWVSVLAGFESLAVPARVPLALRSDPPDAALRWRVRMDGPPVWTLGGRGARLFWLEEHDPRGRSLRRERNDFGDLRSAWLREAGGPEEAWRALGDWPRGAPMPEPGAAGAAPPGWLAAGLPPGVSALVGSLRDPRQTDTAVTCSEVWVRLTGP